MTVNRAFFSLILTFTVELAIIQFEERRRIFMMKITQISESIRLGALLAISGGMMDAYSYIMRGHVFANAQTGNMLLFGVNLSEGNFQTALTYFCPILAFTIGIMLADVFRLKSIEMLHWRQISVLIEAVILFGVAFIPLPLNLLANSLTSLACGIQVESFRKIHGRGIATTMCIGNLRSATQNMCDFFHTKEKKSLRNGFLYFGIISCFILGAILGNLCITLLHEKAILVSAGLLFIAFMIMFIDLEEKGEEI